MDDNGYVRRHKPRRRINILRFAVVCLVAILAIGGIGFGISYGVKALKGKPEGDGKPGVVDNNNKDKGEDKKNNNVASNPLAQADRMAAGYDYDGAIALLKEQADFASNNEYAQAVQRYEQAKAECVPIDVTKVPHIFYHSLVNEPAKTFDVSKLGASYANGHQTWMATTKEFDNVTQALYNNGYVYVRLRDLVIETKNPDGSVSFKKNDKLLLPKNKKAIVLSIDDLSYYHTYEKGGYPTKIVIDENGLPKCEFTNAAGETSIGDYDVVPRLNTFLDQHPDGSYKGARGLIAMTGYNGAFGYRTDVAYKTKEKLGSDQKAWLDAHPDFNWDNDVAEAKKVAEAIKNTGWEFASHTWGHISVTEKSVDTLRIDDEKWKNTVENIVGKVDTIIFAHGNDLTDWKDYAADNAAFQYYKKSGYNFYCNVDGSQISWNQFRPNYIRQGRINIDGFMLNKAVDGKTKVLDTLFDAKSVLDPARPPFSAVAGKG